MWLNPVLQWTAGWAGCCSSNRFVHRSAATYTRQVETFNQAIPHDAEPSASGRNGLRVVVVQATVAMVESVSTGRGVEITPLVME